MKKLVYLLSFAVIVSSCKEKGILLVDSTPVAGDTTFTAAVETPQSKVVLMEEFTGVSCAGCPKAHKVVATLRAKYPTAFSVISIQPFNIPVTNPVKDHLGAYLTKNDNRTQAGTGILDAIYGTPPQLPIGGLDRITENSSVYIARDFWTKKVDELVKKPTLANLSLKSTFNQGTGMAVITVRVAYTSAVNNKQKLTLAIIENGIIDYQIDDLTIVKDYHHEHILRDLLTPSAGAPILTGFTGIEPGRVYERTFVYDMKAHPLWNPDNCKLVAFVSNAEPTDKEILQAAEINLK